MSRALSHRFEATNYCRTCEGRGTPATVCNFVSSFLAKRSVRIVLEGVTSAQMPASDCGLPQGSPLSPILFLFYNADLLASLRTPSTFSVGWIDDVCLVTSGKTAEEVAARANEAMGKVSHWSRSHGAEMDPAKSHVLPLTHSRTAMFPPIKLNGVTIPQTTSTKLLGMILDSKLTLGEHVKAAVAGGRRALGAIKRSGLAQRSRGVNYAAARQLVVACVLTRLDYASTLWFKPNATKTHVFQRCARGSASFRSLT